MRKILIMVMAVLTLLCAVCLFGCTVEEPLTTSEGLEYTYLVNSDSYEVSGIGDCEDTEVVIPSEYDDGEKRKKFAYIKI